MAEMPKAYEPQKYEADIYSLWENSGFFNPDKLPGSRTEPFCIVMPPPNVTGTLHLGHAVMLAIEDLMIRFERMRGKRALWIPGTDHAAIATQTKVEKKLRESTGKTRHDLGREPFLKEVRKFAQESHDVIVNQVKSMGSSCDWSREAYTLDESRTKAVRTVFKMMYDDGLIYRGTRVVNWDPEFQTTLADDEVLTKDTTAKLYTFKYDKAFPIAISTTRPETKFGDTGVAVHPDDERYKALIGKVLEADFCGKKISVKVVADIAVDPAFGTGALGVTPAHSKIDEDIAARHGLKSEQVIGKDGKMMTSAGSLVAGLSTKEAREKTVAELKGRGLILKEEEVPQALPISERGGGVVEELPMLQWFIDVNKKIAHRGGKTLKELSVEAVKGGGVKVMPERFEKVYYHWMENLRDWCISRQIWFGHQIPVWYRSGTVPEGGLSPIGTVSGGQETYVGVEAPEGEGWVQDPDSLDTWFSSGLWTFSTLGWPEQTQDLKTYHPTAVLETGYDILFFWVARMILMTTYALGEVPFKLAYLHGLVRDEQGRKMSKSLGNIIDPLEMNAKYGTDATRLSLVIGSSPGNDIRLSEEKIAGFRNFTNKLWNISRFILSMGTTPNQEQYPMPVTAADHWICSRMDTTIAEVTQHLEHFRFSQAGEVLRDFTWSDFADWYLEVAKIQMRDEKLKASTLGILRHKLQTLLKLWHPWMPFVTEAVWKEASFDGLIMVASWPVTVKPSFLDNLLNIFKPKAQGSFEKIQEVVTTLRNLRAEAKVPAGKVVKATLPNSALFKEYENVIRSLAHVEIVYGEKLALILDQADEQAQAKRDAEEAENLERFIRSLEGRLSNQEFVSKAPKAVIDKERLKLEEAKTRLSQLKK